MRQLGTQPIFGRRFLRHLWGLIRVYWTSPEAPRGTLLLAGAVFLELGVVYANLPHATVISVATRPEVVAYHARRWTITPSEGGATLLEAA